MTIFVEWNSEDDDHTLRSKNTYFQVFNNIPTLDEICFAPYKKTIFFLFFFFFFKLLFYFQKKNSSRKTIDCYECSFIIWIKHFHFNTKQINFQNIINWLRIQKKLELRQQNVFESNKKSHCIDKVTFWKYLNIFDFGVYICCCFWGYPRKTLITRNEINWNLK